MQFHNPYDDDGEKLDANYSVASFKGGFDLVIESSGGSTGGRPARNPDYAQALLLHFYRMAEFNMVLDDLQVASADVMGLPENERRVQPENYALPLRLATVSDFDDLRLAIGRVTGKHRSKSKTGGNRTKRLKFRMLWANPSSMSATSIANMLAYTTTIEEPTAAPLELNRRVLRALNRTRSKEAPSPQGQEIVARISVTSARYARDPEVIAWVLNQADGRCENCGSPAPFIGIDGRGFLEVHHVRPLGEGGPDTIENTAACCPNCHRRLHHDPNKNDLRRLLIKSITRLKDFPVKP